MLIQAATDASVYDPVAQIAIENLSGLSDTGDPSEVPQPVDERTAAEEHDWVNINARRRRTGVA